MKRLVTSVVACAVISLAGSAFSDTGIKLGSVDLRKIAQESDKGKKAAATLKEMADKFQEKLDAKRKELEKMKVDLEKNGAKLTAAKRRAKEKEMQKKIGEFREFGQNAEQELTKKDKELSTQVGEELEKVVRDYGRANGYTVITHKEGVIYNSGDYGVKDLTDDILKFVAAPPQEAAPKK